MTHFDIIPLDARDHEAVQSWLAVHEAVAATDYQGLRPQPPASRLAALALGRTDMRTERWIAVSDERVLGQMQLTMPDRDNTHLGYFDLSVHPDERRRGVGSGLVRHMEERAAANGRTTLSIWLAVPGVDGSKVSGVGAAFAVTKGYNPSLEAAVRVCDLDAVDEAALDRLWKDAWAHAEDFELVTFDGVPGDDIIDGIAHMQSRMYTDMPLGDWDLQEAVIDRERVREATLHYLQRGDLRLHAVVRHKESGRIAGHTEIVIGAGEELHCAQGDTIVDPAFRGKRLGTILKIANQRRVREWRPKMRYVWTGNATSNTQMIAINEAVGYRLHSAENVYQKKL